MAPKPPNRALRNLAGIMLLVVAAGIWAASSHYGRINQAADPRVEPAREMYQEYNRIAREGDFYRIFSLLDSIEMIYASVPHYRQSFEMGVIENNRAAALLTLALHGDSIHPAVNPFHGIPADTLAERSHRHIRSAISLYEDWSEQYGGQDREEIRELILPGFLPLKEEMDESRWNRVVAGRVGEIMDAGMEVDRRLSVCYTNKGVIHRIHKDYEEAAACYEQALELWDRNLEAENNLNRLLGKPLKKRNLLQRLFPPGREA